MTVYNLQTSGLEYLQDDVAPERDGWNRTVTVRWQGHKLRARVRRNFYQHQCHFLVEAWSPAELRWNVVQSLQPESVFDANDPEWARSIKNFPNPDTDPYTLTQGVVDRMLAYAQQIVA